MLKPRIHTGIGTSESHIVHKLIYKRDIIVRAKFAFLMLNRMWKMLSFMLKMGRTDNDFLARVCEEA
jgi:2-isopropylmalate synthase